MVNLIISMGGTIHQNFNKFTDYLLTNNIDSKTFRRAYLINKNAPIIEADFENLL